jgi:N-carbamoylputrescine amidase
LIKRNHEIKVAGIQMSCRIGNKDKNIKKAIKMIEQAARKECQIVCLPEVFNTEYVCFTKRNPICLEYAESIPGPSTNAISNAARENSIYIIAPIFEKAAPGVYYNTASLINPKGEIIGNYRKTHIPASLEPWTGLEKLYFRPGSQLKVFETKLGKIGILICHDGSFPEAWRILALEGAEIIFRPSCISVTELGGLTNSASQIWTFDHIVRAYENAVFVIGINRVGLEEKREHFGSTMIVNPKGDVLAKAGEEEEKVVLATLDLCEVGRDGKVFRDYRPEIYQRITKPPGEK